ncbi:hypothetical protein DTO013F2_5465 [Penicillium roqueforti]|nr:hypothetical protein DTO013F2_5465 [Penicillium roqueforti]KAI3128991.1 hypothetical protein CBS147325_9777 [Penicillium roqueforti]
MDAINGGGSSPFQMSLIDVIFPGFSMVTASAHQLLAGDPDSYTRLLYEALIRPGRSDKKVHFKLTDQNISTQLFHTVFKQSPNQKQRNKEYDDKTIEGLARDFASKMPEQIFSPAEVLSFLLERKKSPSDAVSCVESWVTKAKY